MLPRVISQRKVQAHAGWLNNPLKETVLIGVTFRLVCSTAHILLLPVFEQDLPLRIWELICLKQDGLRPPCTVLQLEIILPEEICKYEFDLMARDPPSRARVSAHPKLHLFLGDAGQLKLLRVLGRSMSQLVKA